MKSSILFSLLLICIFTVGCEKDCGCEGPPFSGTCLEKTFEKFKENPAARAIGAYKYKDQDVYLLDAGESHYDGVSPIIDTKCDTVCHFGGWIIEPCFKEMEFQSFVWER